jgi:uncharacterized protein (UPF0216 family)
VNKHLPTKRKTLAQLLKEEIPHVSCRDGSVHVFKRRELQELRTYVSNDEAERLYLPIIILVNVDMEGALTGIIEGEVETAAVRRLLGIESIAEARPEKLFLYKPQLHELMNRFSTIFQVAITIDRETLSAYGEFNLSQW